MPSSFRTWTIGSLLVGLILLAACSCGSGVTTASSESPATSAVDDLQAWRAAQAAVCDEFEPRVAARSEELGQPATLADAATYFDAMTPLNDQYMAAILEVPAPETRGAEVDRLYDLARQLKATARTAQAAAHFNDEASFSEAVGALEANTDEANELLAELDLPECITDQRTEA